MGFKDKFRNEYFISFRNKNSGAKIAHNIHSGLEKAGYTNYYNPKQHNQEKAGYPKRLYRNVRHCKVFVWVLTEECMMARENKPDYYFAEIIWAHKYKKCIVPVMSPAFKSNRIDNAVLKRQLYIAYENLFQCNILTSEDKKVVDNIVNRYCTDLSFWGGHDIAEENPLSQKIVSEIIDRIGKTRGVHPLKKRWVKIPIIHTAVLLAIFLFIIGIKVSIDMHDQRIWDGSTTVDGGWSSFEGDGSEANPYKIKTAKQLAWLSYTSQSDTLSGKYFELQEDIILNPYDSRGIGNEIETYTDLDGTGERMILDQDATHIWTPIGNEEYPFSGVFIGNNHMIYGLYLTGESDYQGLFGVCSEKSIITGLNMMSITVSPYSSCNYVGSIAGKSDGLIDRCSCYSSMMEGHDYVGGLVGKGNLITNSFSSAWISYNEDSSDGGEIVNQDNVGHLGGLVGECNYLINSSASAMLTCEKGYVGGVAGEVKVSAYNCVDLGIGVTVVSLSKYVENDKPISICNLFGNYDGPKEKYTNLYYEPSSSIGIQMGREEYNNLIKKYPDFFEGYEDSNPELGLAIRDFCMNYHDYCNNSGEYNQISSPIDFSDITNQLNKGVDDVTIIRPDIVELLDEYRIDGQPIKMDNWVESDNPKGAFLEYSKSPWLKNVDSIRENWESSYIK